MIDPNVLNINRKQATWACAVILFCFFLMFLLGYFVGKKSVKVEIPLISLEPSIVIDPDVIPLIPLEPSMPVGSSEYIGFENDEPTVQFVGQLITFGTKKPAEKFVERLAAKDINGHLKVRKTRTMNGEKITRYQIETDSYVDRDELQTLIDRIVKLEHIRNYHIKEVHV